MKRVKKICFVLLLALVLQSAAAPVLPSMQVQAASKKGLVKKGSKYYYYKKGVQLKNKWKTVKVDGVKYRFYFGKNGAAYKAGKLYLNAYNVKLYKIGKKKYGFDSNSHLVSPGVYVDGKSNLYVFGKKGIYSSKKTKEMRKNLAKGQIGKDIYSKVIDILGTPLKVTEGTSCNAWNAEDPFTDVTLTYQYFDVQLVRNDRTNEYKLDNYFSA